VRKTKSAVLLLLVVSVVVFPLFVVGKVNATTEDTWNTMAPLPSSLYNTLGAAVLDGKMYCFGNEVTMCYDPQTNNWTSVSPMPVFNGWGNVVACNNKIYVIGGHASIPTQVYDPATDTWENKTSIPTSRLSEQANAVDNKIYVISGHIPPPYPGVVDTSRDNDVYNTETDSWSSKTPILKPVLGYASAVVDEKIYIFGGGVSTGAPEYKPINLVQIYNTKTNRWTRGADMPTGVCYARACATTGEGAPKRIYVIGGSLTYYYHNIYNVVTGLNQVYDPETNNWTTQANMTTPRADFGVAVIDDAVYAVGGYAYDSYITENEQYTPVGLIPEFPVIPQFLVLFAGVTFVSLMYSLRLRKTGGKMP
jgi:N-acetylneuraminic acid mutarotase